METNKCRVTQLVNGRDKIQSLCRSPPCCTLALTQHVLREEGARGKWKVTGVKSQHTVVGTWWKGSQEEPEQNAEQAVTWLGVPSMALQGEAPVLGPEPRTVP